MRMATNFFYKKRKFKFDGLAKRHSSEWKKGQKEIIEAFSIKQIQIIRGAGIKTYSSFNNAFVDILFVLDVILSYYYVIIVHIAQLHDGFFYLQRRDLLEISLKF